MEVLVVGGAPLQRCEVPRLEVHVINFIRETTFFSLQYAKQTAKEEDTAQQRDDVVPDPLPSPSLGV